MRILLLCAATFVVGLLAGAMLWPEPGAERSRARDDGRPGPEFPAADRGRYADAPRGDGGGTRAAAPKVSRNADVRTLTGAAAAELERIQTSDRAAAFLAGTGTSAARCAIRPESRWPASW